MSQQDEPNVTCSAGCKREVLLSQVGHAGWENLPITGRWRCPQCWRELQAVNSYNTALRRANGNRIDAGLED